MSAKIISLADIRRRMQSGQTLRIIDVRTPAEFAAVHVSGAQLVPLDSLDPSALAASCQGAGDPLLVICQSGGRAAKACEKLHAAGLAEVFCIEGGTTAWERAGLPVERGQSRMISLERQVRIAAGALVLIGLALAWAIHPYFIALTAFVGVGLVFAGITDFCGMGLLLGKAPWNRRANRNPAVCGA